MWEAILGRLLANLTFTVVVTVVMGGATGDPAAAATAGGCTCAAGAALEACRPRG